MNTPKVLPIAEKYKNQIEKTFKFVEDIIYVRLENDDTKNEWKYVLISLDEAESIIDMINATSDAELKANSKVLKGELYKKISKILLI